MSSSSVRERTLKGSESIEFPSRIEGWLNVWDIDNEELRILLEDGAVPAVGWEPVYCALFQDKLLLSHFRTEEALDEIHCKLPTFRLDEGKEEFDKRWGYSTILRIQENALQHEPHEFEPSYERTIEQQQRRGSLPLAVPVASVDDSVDGTSNKIMNFFSKKTTKTGIKRTKSNSKLDKIVRKQTAVDPNDPHSDRLLSNMKRSLSLGRLNKTKTDKDSNDNVSLINTRMRTSLSHESLFNSTSRTVDLSGTDVEIRPLHSSILGQEHCFQVLTSNGSKFYSCRSAEEREKWIECLRKTMHPGQEQTRRTDNSLKLWVLEAKNVQPKKRYFCEICLDRNLYARTSTKQKGDLLFWGEHFEFHNLPPVDTITINVYREADKKKKKDKNVLIGYINIPVSDINSRQLAERWYPASSGLVGKGTKDAKTEQAVVRVKARYQAVDILPMDHYNPLVQYITTDYMELVSALEPALSVKAKEDLATSLVRILQKVGGAKTFLTDVVMSEIKKLENDNLTFRGNSVPTKAMEAYMKLVGEKYLQDTLGEFIRVLIEAPDECEVDPSRIQTGGSLSRHQTNLTMYCEMAWAKIINSFCYFPRELWEVFSSFRQKCEDAGREDVADNIISACIFLRLLCPSIMSPSLFGITQELPDEKSSRNLTLIAKTIQNLANFTKFGTKESYMIFMNEFVEREWVTMKNFLKQISSSECKGNLLEFDGYIDLGKELSILHTQLSEGLLKLEKGAADKLSSLSSILDKIAAAKDNPNAGAPPVQPPGDITALLNLGLSATNSITVTTDTSVSGEPARKDIYTSDDSSRTTYANRQHVNGMSCVKTKRLGVDLAVPDDYVLYGAMDGAESPGAGPLRRPPENQLNRTWRQMVSAAEVVNGDYVDLITFMDEEARRRQDDGDGSQVSVGQLSTVASSGYQSFGNYSQSSSPVDLAGNHDEHGDPRHSPVGLQNMQPLSFSNPLFQHREQSIVGRRDSETSSSSISEDVSTPSQHNMSFDDGDKLDQRRDWLRRSANDSSLSGLRKVSSDQVIGKRSEELQKKTSVDNFFSRPSSGGSDQKTVGVSGSASGSVRKISIDNVGRTVNIDTSGRKISIDSGGKKISVAAGNSGPSVQVRLSRTVPERRDSHEVMLRYAQANSRSDNELSGLVSSGDTMCSSSKTLTGDLDLRVSQSSPKNTRKCNNVNSSAFNVGLSLSESAPSLSYRSSIHRPISDYTDLSSDAAAMSNSSAPPKQYTTLPSSGHSRAAAVTTPSSTNPHYSTSVSLQTINTQSLDDAVSASTPRTLSSDNILSKSPDTQGFLTNHERRLSVPQNPVRMGIRSVHMKIQEQDKAKETERELEKTQLQLKDTQDRLREAELQLTAHKEMTDRLIDEWRQKLHDREREMSEQKYEKELQERQMKDIIQRLVGVEEEMRKEQIEMQLVVQQKTKLIESQERRIQSLDAANARLLSALSQMRDRYAQQSSSKSTAKMTLSVTENGEFKNSQC